VFPENREDGGSNTFADDGTASHTFAALLLEAGHSAADKIGWQTFVNDVQYGLDEARADFIQIYLDDVRRRAIGGHLFVEQHVDLSEYLGEGQGGTADAAIYKDGHLIVEDLKYGTGEKVYAKDNPQLLLYALGLLKDFALFGDIEKVTVVICQPRLGHIDEFSISVEDLLEGFAKKASEAVYFAKLAMDGRAKEDHRHPGNKQCRWCRAVLCTARENFIMEQTRSDFEVIEVSPPIVPRDTAQLSTAYSAVPLIEDWCRAVRYELGKLVAEGAQVIGSDGKPFKFVEGKQGARAWDDPKAAEAALVGQLGPKAYTEPKILTAPAAAKLLDKKATKALWADVFEPMIKKAPGKPVLALGSDERPPYSGTAEAGDFEELE
jgi:uncharacterized protein DUF2800